MANKKKKRKQTKRRKAIKPVTATSVAAPPGIPLRFPAPRPEWSSSHQSLHHWWGQLQHGLDINDPASFPDIPAGVVFTDWDTRVLRQYIRVAKLVAESTVINADTAVTVSFTQTEESVTDTFVPDDAEAGFLARFRLLYPDNAHGGFSAAHDTLMKHLKASADHVSELDRWKEAVAQLKQKSIERICLEKGMASGDIVLMPDIGTYPDRRKPKDTIDEYFNGEYFHWQGLKADVIDQRRETRFARRRKARAGSRATGYCSSPPT